MRPTHIIAVFIASFLFSTFIKADETALSIDAQIEAIKKAPPHQRVKIMNALKERLADMNRQERAKAIAQMRAKIQNNTHINHKYTNKAHDTTQEQQILMQEKMADVQNRDHRHIGDQHKHGNMQEPLPNEFQQHSGNHQHGNDMNKEQHTDYQHVNNDRQQTRDENKNEHTMHNRDEHHRR